MDWGQDQYRYIDFIGENDADIIVHWRKNDLHISQIRERTEHALITIINEIKRTSQDTLHVIEENTQPLYAQNMVITNQTLSPEDPVSFAISTDYDKAISPKFINRIWFYLGVGVILLFAFFYLLRKKTKQKNS